jgi:hypothetical protein
MPVRSASQIQEALALTPAARQDAMHQRAPQGLVATSPATGPARKEQSGSSDIIAQNDQQRKPSTTEPTATRISA